MTVKIGLDCKLYRNTGTYGSPSWNEITAVRDLTLNLEKATADVTTRGNNGWRAEKNTLKNGRLEFDTLDDPDDADITALRSAWENDTDLDILVLNGSSATSGSKGLRATMQVRNQNESQPLEGAVTISWQLSPTYDAANAPTAYEVP